MKNLRNKLLGISRNVGFFIIGVAVVAFLMFYHLITITPGFSQKEIDVYNSAKSASAITSNLVNTPYKSAVFISMKVFGPEVGLRYVGALIGIFTVVVFYFLIREFYGDPIALATTTMFATSSLFLGMTRTATPNVMLLSLMAILATGAYIKFGKRNDISWLLATFVLGFSLYVPGMILFVVPIIIWQFNFIRDSLSKVNTKLIIVMSLILGLLITPLIFSIATEPSIIKEYLGFNEVISPVSTMLKYAGVTVLSLFVMSPVDSAYWLGRQPVLDVFATTMFVCGTYSFIRKYKLNRLWLVIGVLFLSVLWIGATTNRYAIIILLPFIYLIVGAGIRLLTDRWFEVFPKNPIAKYLGVSLLAIAILASINFQLNRYFIAWSNHKPTKEAFSQQIPKNIQ